MDDTEAALDVLSGSTLLEKLSSIGIEPGRMIEIRHLNTLGHDYGLTVYLFFEKDLATTRTISQIEKEYKGVPEYERPYIRVDRFLKFTQQNDPSFSQTLDEFPLMLEIVRVFEERNIESRGTSAFIFGLMPFLDEFDVDKDPTKQVQ